MLPRRAVYTALLGDYEQLNEQPVALQTDVPFICFTDDPGLTSETWQVRLVEPLFPLDLVRSQRAIKIRGHESLDAFEETLYIDNSVSLKQDPNAILDVWLATSDYGVSLHSFRDRVIDEFDEVIALNYDDASRVHEQLLQYARLYPDVLYEKPYWNGILARRNTEQVRAATRLWFDHVLRYSRRDQLSANVSLALSGVQVTKIEQDNNLSAMHAWPVDVKRRVRPGGSMVRPAGPLLAEIARLEIALSRAERTLEDYPKQVTAVSALTAEVQRLGVEAERARVDAEQARIRGEQRVAYFESSGSWRVTRPLRWLRGNPLRRK